MSTDKGMDILNEILNGKVQVQMPTDVEAAGNKMFHDVTGLDYEIVRKKYSDETSVMLNQVLTDLWTALGAVSCVFAMVNRVMMSEEFITLFNGDRMSINRERALIRQLTAEHVKFTQEVHRRIYDKGV